MELAPKSFEGPRAVLEDIADLGGSHFAGAGAAHRFNGGQQDVLANDDGDREPLVIGGVLGKDPRDRWATQTGHTAAGEHPPSHGFGAVASDIGSDRYLLP